MQVQAPSRKNEVNWNTLIVPAGFLVTIGTMLVGFGEFRASTAETMRNLDALEEDVTAWRAGHMEYHRERSTDVQTNFARLDERVKAVEALAATVATQEHRIRTLEAGADAMIKNMSGLTASVNTMSGDIRVIREGVVRLERSREGPQQ